MGGDAFWLSLYLADLDAGTDRRDPFSLPLFTHLSSYNTQLAITSSSYLVFSFIVAYTAMLATQQRLIYARVRQMAFLDPVVHMPNLRALSRALNGASWSTLCFLRIPELELLGRLYGVLLRINSV